MCFGLSFIAKRQDLPKQQRISVFCEEVELFLVLSVASPLHKNTLYQTSNEGKQAKQISKKA
jgi:hypothetical protein